MNNKLRQKILSELKTILKEDITEDFKILRTFEERHNEKRIQGTSEKQEAKDAFMRLKNSKADPYLCDHFPVICREVQGYTMEDYMKPSSEISPTTGPAQQTGKYFRCKNKDDVAVFQQYLGVVVDCMIGPDTMSKAIEKGTKINLQDLQDPQKQASFCTSLQTNRQGYVDAIKKTNQAVKKCPVAGSVKKNSSKNNAVVSKQEFEKSLQQTIKSKLNAGQNREEVEKWAEDQRQSWARQIYKESKNYYDNKKLNEAKQLFDKLLKGL